MDPVIKEATNRPVFQSPGDVRCYRFIEVTEDVVGMHSAKGHVSREPRKSLECLSSALKRVAARLFLRDVLGCSF